MRRSNYDLGEVLYPELSRTGIALRKAGGVIGYILLTMLIAIGTMAAIYGPELKRCEQSGGTFNINVDKKNECVLAHARR